MGFKRIHNLFLRKRLIKTKKMYIKIITVVQGQRKHLIRMEEPGYAEELAQRGGIDQMNLNALRF